MVDGNNVIGSVPDGWWRDRPGAVRRLLARLQCHGRQTDDRLILVLDVPQADLPEGSHDGVEVRYATRKGRDAADDRIIALLDEGTLQNPEVITSDRALSTQAHHRAATVTGAATFLTRLATTDC